MLPLLLLRRVHWCCQGRWLAKRYCTVHLRHLYATIQWHLLQIRLLNGLVLLLGLLVWLHVR